MLKMVFVIFLLVLSIVIIPPALAQEFKNPSFSENLVVAYNHQLRMGDDTGSIMMVKTSGDVEVSVGLQSSSNDEFKFSNSTIETLRQEPILNSIVFTNKEDALMNANALIVTTEWKEFWQPNYTSLDVLEDRIIFEGRNILNADQIRKNGFTYIGIGI